MSSNGVVEMTISNGGYGGDFVRLPNGDLQLSVDTQDDAPATEERLARYCLTNPRTVDAYGNAISRGDHPAYQKLGAGLGQFVGAQASLQAQNDIHTAVSDQITTDPYIVQDPQPTITTVIDPLTQESVAVLIEAQTAGGAAVKTNAIPLRQGV